MEVVQRELAPEVETPMAAPLAELVSVSKTYGAVSALSGFDLNLQAGELVAILGPNGAGKTTAVKLLLGLTRPDDGKARLFGQKPWAPAARMRVGAMLQISKVPETLRVREHLELFASYYPAPLAMETVVVAAGLDGLLDRLFGKLSGGQQQRVLFALALIGNPDFLILDEPTAGLDVESRRTLWREIRRRVADGRTVLLTTHYIEEAENLADRVVVINNGVTVAEGTPAQVKARVSGRLVRCVTRLKHADLRRLPGVQELRQDGKAVEIFTTAAEGLTAALLASDPDLGGLEISSIGLEEAFLALTSPQTSQGKSS